jgi:ribosome biogenesis GTPase / thiamine phosphate phosphatase
MALTDLGWHAGLDAAFAPFATAGFEPARVAVAYGATFRVYTEDGDELADLAGRLRHEATGRRDLPAVGDWVAVKRTSIVGGRAIIHGLLPRKSLFSRKAAGDETAEQIVAANVDTAFLMTALDRDFNLRRIERYLVMTWESGAAPVIILNKADLEAESEARRAEVHAIALDVPIHVVSAREQTGLEQLDDYLRPGQTIAVLGSSGVGKSTLINRLLGVDRLRTNDVRESDHRGRHTTTHRELVRLPGGALLIDTPGMRELQLWSADAGVAETFDDIVIIGRECHFADCAHEHEPRCAVKQAVAEGRLDAARLESFHKLQKELSSLAVRQDVLAQQTEKKKLRAMFRAFRKQEHPKGHS